MNSPSFRHPQRSAKSPKQRRRRLGDIDQSKVGNRRGDVAHGLQCQARQRALARQASGTLPAVIAATYGRHERWGRASKEPRQNWSLRPGRSARGVGPGQRTERESMQSNLPPAVGIRVTLDVKLNAYSASKSTE